MSAPITEKVSDERLAQAQAYAAKVSKGVPLDPLWEVFALGLKELQQLRITATAGGRALALINEYAGNDLLWADNVIYTRRLILAAVTAAILAKGETK